MKYGLLTIIGFLFCSCFCISADKAKVDWLGKNLLPDPSFEQQSGDFRKLKNWDGHIAKKTKAKITAGKTQVLQGKQSLELTCPDSPSSASIRSKLLPVIGGKKYFFSIAFCSEGFNRQKKGHNKYEGVSSSCSIEWYDANKKPTGKRIGMGFPYASWEWDIRDKFVYAPPLAKFAIISISISNNSLKHTGKTIPSTVWVDSLRFSEHLAPPTPEWAKGKTPRIVEGGAQNSPLLAFFLAEDDRIRNRGGKWSKIKVDTDAERGGTLEAPAGVGKGIMGHSPYFPALPPGLYRLRCNVKVSDNKTTKPAGFIDIATQLASARLLLEIDPRKFSAPNKYQNFEKDFIFRSPGWWCFRMYTNGNQAWSIDSIKIFPLQEFEDRQLLSIYPAAKSQIRKELTPEKNKTNVLMIAGVGYDYYRMNSVFHLLCKDVDVTPVWARRDRAIHIKNFPETPEKLFEYSLICLSNVSFKAFNLMQKSMINEYVNRGGALVVLGGHQSYERGSVKGSLIEEVMPVISEDNFEKGLVKFPKGAQLKSGKPPWLQEADYSTKPLVFFMHRVKTKSNAQVFVTVDDKPFMIGSESGKGRVVCVTGMPFGNPEKGQTGFWQWNDWPYLMRNAILWALRR